jgi:REP element-mobilizing transposase RayT
MARIFIHQDSQAGVFHVTNRFLDRVAHFAEENTKDHFLKIMRAYEDLLGVEVLTFCLMSNHFHLLVRVPHRPAGFDVPLDVMLARMERAVGDEAMALVRTQLDLWTRSGLDSAIEEWRQRQIARMFNLSEFVRRVKLRFTRWHNRKQARRGTIWEDKFGSVVVEEEERALRTMAAYIDLNPVRAGIVADPAEYRWCGYAEAMAGVAKSRRGLVRIVGQMAWSRATAAEAKPWGDEAFPEIVETRSLVIYRALLGGQGREQRRADGSVLRRGLSEKVREKLTTPNERRLAAEVLLRRVQHFSRGAIIGSRKFIDQWFEAHRDFVKGSSRVERKRGSRSLGKPALRGLYALRDPGA